MKSITDDLVKTCDEILKTVAKSYDDPTKTVAITFNNKKAAYKTDNFYILLAFFKFLCYN